MSAEPIGFYEHVLVVDCETSGLFFQTDDPSYNPVTNETYQIVSIGLIVAESKTLKPVEKLYLELKYDSKNNWSVESEKIHGLSQAYLNEHGVTEEEAVVQIANLIIKYWGTTSINGLGHNFVSFDLPFLKRLLRNQGLEMKFAARHVDTNSVGFAALGTYHSDELFETFGFERKSHNAMEDAEFALKTVYNIRKIFDGFLS